MATHVLVPIDGSPQANAALVHAAETFPDAKITLLYVADPVDENVSDLSSPTRKRYEVQREDADRLFERARERLDGEDLAIETEVQSGSPWRQIVEFTEEGDVDHVVMGSHGRDGASRLLLGSVAELVVRRASVPVTVVK